MWSLNSAFSSKAGDIIKYNFIYLFSYCKWWQLDAICCLCFITARWTSWVSNISSFKQCQFWLAASSCFIIYLFLSKNQTAWFIDLCVGVLFSSTNRNNWWKYVRLHFFLFTQFSLLTIWERGLFGEQNKGEKNKTHFLPLFTVCKPLFVHMVYRPGQ